MPSYSEKLAHLLHLVETSSDLRDPFRYFMDEIALNRDFMSGSSSTRNKMVQVIIKKALKEYFNLTANTNQCMIMEFREDKSFHHGTCPVTGQMLVFFYFTTRRIGMVAMSRLGDNMTHYFRFRTLVTNGEVTFVPGDPSVTH
ncbi:MAG: hypothetical protein HQL56_18265 [Magnetococcales bacterium]|nr:hypothetical protein [Magnetococcales bacterium]